MRIRVHLPVLDSPHQRYRFAPALAVDLRVDPHTGDATYQAVDFDVWGEGRSQSEALSDLAEGFDYAWREYAQANDDSLDPVAVEFKRHLLGHVAVEAI
jgi:hypothetical protein